ncbi:MAG: hypothetical protein ACREUM_11915, partial [Nitrosospira sp.]
MATKFSGFGITGYRSLYGASLQFVGPLDKVNLLAGQNNAGKSNVIRFLTEHLQSHIKWHPSGLDIPRGDKRAPYRYALCLPNSSALEELESPLPQPLRDQFEKILSSDAFRLAPDSNSAWIEFEQAEGKESGNIPSRRQADQVLDFASGCQTVSDLSRHLTSHRGGGRYDDYDRVMHRIVRLIPAPPVVYIDAFRQIREDPEGAQSEHTGLNLISMIARLQNPEAIEQEEAERKYGLINKFVSNI